MASSQKGTRKLASSDLFATREKALQIRFLSDRDTKQRQIYVVKCKDNLDRDIIRI